MDVRLEEGLRHLRGVSQEHKADGIAACSSDHGSTTDSSPRPSRKRARVEGVPLRARLVEIVRVVLPVGLYAWGGPAGMAAFQETFVTKVGWVTDREFADVFALGMTLPGPSNSIMITAMGTYRAGVLGGLLAFLCWSLPSVVVLVAAGLGLSSMHGGSGKPPAWMSGLAPAAVTLIFVAYWRLSRSILQSRRLHAAIAICSAAAALVMQNEPGVKLSTFIWFLPLLIVVGGTVTTLAERVTATTTRRSSSKQVEAAAAGSRPSSSRFDDEEPGLATAAQPQDHDTCLEEDQEEEEQPHTYERVPVPPWFSLAMLAAVVLLVALTAHGAIREQGRGERMVDMFSRLFLAGVAVYGGGHVVLPVLINVCVKPHWLTVEQFMEGYALVQMLPGPLFNISAYVGAVHLGLTGAVVGYAALSLPGLMLVVGLLPFWDRLRRRAGVKAFLAGVNCAGLGLILFTGVSLYLQVVTSPAAAVVTVLTGSVMVFRDWSTLPAVLLGGLAGLLLSPIALDLGQHAFITTSPS